MRILNFGSLNIDHVYAVPRFVRPGETLASSGYRCFSGGKGFNQSIALAHAGARVFHAGKVGRDGAWLPDRLRAAGVDTSLIQVVDAPSGHAIIQVNPAGQNAIVLHGGANRLIGDEDAERVLAGFGAGDMLLLQNEISAVPEIMRLAARRGLSVAFNPAPADAAVAAYPLESVSLLIVNEIEGAELAGVSEPEAIQAALRFRYPAAAVVLTLGEQGVLYADDRTRLCVPAERVAAVDTTAAGDTFIGYYLAGVAAGVPVAAALRTASRAAAICVTRRGAADSIPHRDELR